MLSPPRSPRRGGFLWAPHGLSGKSPGYTTCSVHPLLASSRLTLSELLPLSPGPFSLLFGTSRSPVCIASRKEEATHRNPRSFCTKMLCVRLHRPVPAVTYRACETSLPSPNGIHVYDAQVCMSMNGCTQMYRAKSHAVLHSRNVHVSCLQFCAFLSGWSPALYACKKCTKPPNPKGWPGERDRTNFKNNNRGARKRDGRSSFEGRTPSSFPQRSFQTSRTMGGANSRATNMGGARSPTVLFFSWKSLDASVEASTLPWKLPRELL